VPENFCTRRKIDAAAGFERFDGAHAKSLVTVDFGGVQVLLETHEKAGTRDDCESFRGKPVADTVGGMAWIRTGVGDGIIWRWRLFVARYDFPSLLSGVLGMS
jgi:hypothetical protein